MQAAIDNLRERFGMNTADALAVPRARAAGGHEGIVPFLKARQVHEFCDPTLEDGQWEAPLSLLAAVAGELAGDEPVVWVGRRCWPTFHFFRSAGSPWVSRRAHLFLDPLSDAERLWSVLEAARCPAVRVVVADGSGLTMTAGRRLQLAAETGNAVVLLARPPSEFLQSSWAATRWEVRPMPSSTVDPRWDIALVRATGAKEGQDASRHWIVSWTYEVFRGAGTLGLSPAVGRGADTTAEESAAAVRRESA